MTKARNIASANPAPTTVSTTELGYVDGVTSAIQTQLDTKQAVVSGVDNTEIGYLDGVTSAIQTQMDAKLATATAASTYQTIVSGVDNTEIGYLNGVTSAIQTQLNAKAPSSLPTLTAPILVSPEERWVTSASVATGTVQFDADTQGVLYYTGTSSANWVLNVRGSSGTTLNSKLAVGDSLTVSFIATNTTAYYMTSLTLDGAAQTIRWSGGTAPTAGNASSTDAYQFTIVKTAATPTYTVFGAGPVKYA